MLPIGPSNNGRELESPRLCGKCRATHTHVPEAAPFKSGLYWWDCGCGSTLTATEPMLKFYVDVRNEKVQKELVRTKVEAKKTAIVVDQNNVSHIVHLPCWTSDYRLIQIMLNKKPCTIELVKITKSFAYFKVKV